MGGIVFKNACAAPHFKPAARQKAGGYHKEVGDVLREYREKLGVSQSELSRRTGIPQARISHYERSDYRMSPAIAKVLAKALKTNPEALLPNHGNIPAGKFAGISKAKPGMKIR
ncbi:MAG: helix-turn-helix domain-containing protein [Planctomycetota bacterium]|nr:helix-turn-helix domain-containing protein [Planctomycetota bacterium]